MYLAKFEKITLNFKSPSGTSRGVLKEKDSWILHLWRKDKPETIGKGEASIIKSLSPDWSNQYPQKLNEIAENINHFIGALEELNAYPSIQFAIETAKLDLKSGGHFNLFPLSGNSPKIHINGLIWMGDKGFMKSQIEAKIEAGFSCIKMKIGAIDFRAELALLDYVRSHFSAQEIELRVDANGAFNPENALNKLTQLSKYDLHSIEQPIKQGQVDQMRVLCQNTPLPIALDEELIGIHDYADKLTLLSVIKPQYIILKPSLIGGFNGTDEWIEIANKLNIKWWITSALEANIGLNAIAQYTYTKQNPLPQGLGTGSLFTNNIEPFLSIDQGHLLLK